MTSIEARDGSSPEMDAKLAIVLGADDRYAPGLSVTVASALRNLRYGCSALVVILDGGISDESRERIMRVIGSFGATTEVRWHSVDTNLFTGLRLSDWGSPANYLRLLIPRLIPEEFEWAIYLDSDLLVRTDLSSLVEEVSGQAPCHVWAVQSYFYRTFEAVWGTQSCLEMGLDPTAPFFNSGMMLINTTLWRRHRVTEDTLAFGRMHASKLRFSDQDALNGVIGPDRWRALDDSWNVMLTSLSRYVKEVSTKKVSARRQKSALVRNGRVLHYVTGMKPWMPGYDGPAGSEFRRILYRSGWFDTRREQIIWMVRYWAKTPFKLARRRVLRMYRRTRRYLGLMKRYLAQA